MVLVPAGVVIGMESAAVPPATAQVSPRGTLVRFRADCEVPLSPERTWAELRDWPGHARWVPMTRVDVDPHDGDRFVAWSGIGPLALEDRMVMHSEDFDGRTGRCEVHKLGPHLTGTAVFTVSPGHQGQTTRVIWDEEVLVPYLPRLLRRPVAAASARFFAHALRRMARMAED